MEALVYFIGGCLILHQLKEKMTKWLNLKPGTLVVNSLLQGRGAEPLIGLDIGPEQLRLLQINLSNSPYRVENYSVSALPEGVIVKDEIKDFSAVSHAIREMFRNSNISTKSVALAIPRSLAIIKNITVDARLNSEEIESRAMIEANRHFPDLVGDSYLDFVITGPSAQDKNQLELILVACRKEQIKPYLEIIRLSGLIPKIVDINSYALERALPLTLSSESPLETVALLNININLSTFIVIQNGNLIHAHDQTFDGHRLMSQVKAYCKTKGTDQPDQNDEEYLTILRENLISHLRHIVHFFYSSRSHITIQQIILSGDCASMPHLANFVQKEIGVETILADPFKKMVFAKNINAEELKKNGAAMMLCCGLAMSHLD